MEIPAPVAGTITAMLVKQGDRISAGSDVLVLDVATAADTDTSATSRETSTTQASAAAASNEEVPHSKADDPNAPAEQFDLVVLGAGPGGYTAAFRAADLGLSVLLIERYASLGGVCLNVGCIPSKALLHTAAVIQETQEMAAHGVSFGKVNIDIDKLRGFKEEVIGKLTNGLSGLAKQRKITVAHGLASFDGSHSIQIALVSNTRSSLQAHRAFAFPDFPMRTSASWTPPERSNWPIFQSDFWSSAVESSAWKWAASMRDWAVRLR